MASDVVSADESAFSDLEDPYLSPFVARIYDAEQANATEDIAWVLRLAAATGGTVADLGCGTGRLTIPLAAAGHCVIAVDRSSAMLTRLRQKLAAQPEAVRRRIQTEEADLLRWRATPASIGAAFLGYNTFAALPTTDQQRRLLDHIAAAMQPRGVVAIATAAVGASVIGLPEGLTREVYRRPAPEIGPGAELTRLDIHRWTDETLQLRRLAVIYDIHEQDGGWRREQFEYAARYTSRWELEHLLARGGFGNIQANGGYTGEPFSVEGGLLVMIAQRL